MRPSSIETRAYELRALREATCHLGVGDRMPDAVIRSTEARIGEVLRQLREKLGLSLRTLAAQAGFSASFMSQVENGQVSPSIASLEKIAGELGVSLADLFEASQTPTPAVVRGDARPGFTSMWSKARVELLTPSGERRAVAAVAVSLTPGGASGKHPSNHPTDQFAMYSPAPSCCSWRRRRSHWMLEMR